MVKGTSTVLQIILSFYSRECNKRDFNFDGIKSMVHRSLKLKLKAFFLSCFGESLGAVLA